jgi:hypothetical protein
MDFFQRLGNFFTGKGWVSDEEKRRKEQQAQQPQQRPQPVQQPQLNNQPRMNMPWANNSGGLNQSSQPKVNLNPLQQANQVNQQLNLNSQNNQQKPLVTTNDAPKMLTPEGQQDWANKQNKQIQIQNANNQPIQPQRPQPVQQQPQPQTPKPFPVQPQQPRPQTITSPNVINQQNDMRRMGIDPNPVHTAIRQANEELNQYKTAQAQRQDIIDNKMRARGVSEPEIAKNRQTRIQLENQARASADEARRSQNMANIVGAVTAPGRAVASATKGFIDGAGRTVGDTGDKLSLAIADAMYGITGDEKYSKTRQRIIQQGQQRNAQYDKQFGVFKKNDADVDVAYELGQSGQRLIQDIGTGVATAGVAPVVRQFAENAADFVTDANAHGKNTRDVLPAAYANAAAQAAIEKVGLDRVLSPGGKTVARRMIKSALAEGGEEAAQQLTENAFAKHTYDPDRKYSEGVVKSALMGAALGGPAGAGNFGGVRHTENQPSAAMSTQIAQSQPMQQQATGKLEQEALAQRQARQSEQQQTQQAQPQIQNQNTNQNAGYSDFYRRPAENTSLRQAAEVNAVNTRTSQTHPIQQVNVNQTVQATMPNASPALKQAVSQNISDIQRGDTNAIATRQQTTGKLENYLIEQATQNVQDTVAQDVRYKMDNQSNTQLSADPVMNVRNADGETMADMTARLQNEGVSPQGIQMAQERFRSQAENYIANPQSMPAWSMPGAAENADTNYMMAHRPDENGPRAFNMEEGGMLNGFYDSPSSFGVRASEASHQESMDALNAIRSNPNADVTIYRAAPSPELNDGDWVTLSQTYAEQHQESNLNGSGEIHAFTVKAKDLRFAGDDINEFGYFPNQGDVDVKMQLVNETMNEAATTTMETLKARHLDLTGDEKLVFNEWQNEMQREALGYYDPKTDKINLNRLSEDTLNHELGHKLLERADNKQELLTAIRRFYGDNYLINKYGQQYGAADINLLAEEQLADGFSDYYNGKLNGETTQRLAARLHIPQRIVAIYDRITEAIRGLIGKQDIIKQFYAQMETGKFRNTQQQVPGGDGRLRMMSIEAAHDGRNIVVVNNNILKGVPGKQVVPTIRKYLNENFKGNNYPLNFGKDGTGRINRNTIRKYVDPHQTFEDILVKGKMAGELPDILKVSKKYAEAPDTKAHSFAKDGFEYRTARIEIDGQQFDVTINVGLNDKGKLIYAFNNIKRIPANRSSRRFSSGDSDSSVANSTQNVNTDPRYKLDQSQNHSKPSAIDNLNNAMDKYRADKQRRQQPLQETINNIQDNPKPKITKELRQAIDNFIFENIDENLFLENTATDIQGSNGSEWSIPRIHVDDLRHYLGDLTEDLPSAYKRRTGKRDIDTVAQEMGYDDIDSFIDEVTRVAEARRAERERKEQLAEWRRDPDVIEEAQKIVNARHAEEAKKQAEAKRKAEEVKAHNEQLKKQQALDEVLVRGLDEGPRHKIADIVHNASLVVGIDEKTVAKRFAKIAEQKGYDITGERAFLTVDPHAGSMLDENGRLRPIDEIAPNIKEKIKLPGAEHAVPAPTTTSNTVAHNTRQMIYKDENGAYHSFYEYRNIHGKWQRTGQEAVRVTSPLQNKFIDKIRSDKTVNEEAKRAYEDGLAIQYIWRENSKGINAELVSTFDGYMKTGNKKEYRPSDKLVTFNPNKHHIESGRVVDSATGQILGNYIEMTPEGNVTIYAGKKKMNLNMRDIDFSQLKEMKSGAGQTWTTEGVIDRVTGALRRSNSLNYFKSGVNKTKEALMSIMSELPRQANAAAVKEGNAIGQKIKDYRKNFLKQAKKHGPLKRQMLQEAVFVIEPARVPRGEKVPSYKERLHAFEEVYGKPAAEALDQYNGFLRAVYKNLLIRQNEIRVALGKDPIMERKDYITHLGELQSSKGAIASMYNGAKNLMSAGDLPTASRKSLPAKLAGRTGLFKPNQKFNQFAMQRVGDVKPIDPFTPLMEYSKIALHNIHMTDAITMNRSLEVAVRAASEARQEFAGKGTNGIQKLADRIDGLYKSIKAGEINQEELIQARNKLYGLSRAIGREIDGVKELHKAIKKIDKLGAQDLTKNDVSNLKEATNKMADSLDKMLQDVEFMQQMTDSANGLTQFVGFVQEHANRLAGKTDPFQRTVTDTEPSLARKFTDTVARGLMKQAALSKIVGNVNSAIAQTASMPTLLATTDAKSLLQAFKRKNREAILQKSNALALRYADDNLSDDTKFEKTMKVAGIPMEFIEKNVIEYTFLAKYNQAINNGLSDADAVRYAERFINDTVTLRDQISTPRAYNRLWMASFLQFSREVSQQNRYVWNQMTGKQKVAFFVNVAIMYNVLEAVTGNKPGADPMGALLEIIADWMGNDEDDDDKDASVQAKLGRTLQKVSSEAISATPIVSSIVNSATTKEDRQKLFGKESSLGRYDGTLPIASLLRTTASIKGNLDEAGAASEEGDDDKADAKTKAAMYRALSELPAGNQLKKTIQGLTAAHSGEAKDGNGEVKAEFEKDNPFYLTQGALFGKNAILPVQVENGDSSWLKLLKLGGITANASDGIHINMPGSNNQNNQQAQQQTADGQLNLEGLNKKDALSIKKKLKKGDYQFKDGLLVSKSGEVERSIYKKLAESQGESDEAYSNWMKAYNIDDVSTLKKEFKSSNDILNKLENGEKKDDKAKSAVDILMGKHKDLPDWAKERYYKESGYSKEQIEYGAMTTHKEVSLMDNYWRQKAQESSHEELMQALTNGRRKSIVGQMFAKNGIVNKLKAEGYITKQEAKALNAAEFDVDGNRITKEGSGGSGSGRGGSGRGRGRSGVSTASPLISAAVKSINSLSSAAPRANKTSGSGRSIDQIGKNLISKMNTQKQVNTALKQWNGGNSSKKPRVRTTKARA